MSKTNQVHSLFSLQVEPLDLDKPYSENEKHIEELLYRELNLRTVVAFIGAGFSKALGYPLWDGLSKEVLNKTLEIVKSNSSDKITNEDKIKLERFSGKGYKALTFPVIFGECERILNHIFEKENYLRNIIVSENIIKKQKKIIDLKLKKDPKFYTKLNNPYVALLDLPIKRFVTFNYDTEMERAIWQIKKYEKKEDFELGSNKCFTQKRDFCEKLAIFSLAKVEEAKNMVFHCHGHIDDPDSLVLTEEDYNKWYIKDSGEDSVNFRQTLDLLFSSNPILFLGFSLDDADLTRWLRVVTVNRQFSNKNKNPIFAILPRLKNDKKWEDEALAFYIRYGVHILPFYVTKEDFKENKVGEKLCQKLIGIEEGWHNWWRGLLEKPKIKKFTLARKKTYFHYEFFNLKNNFIQTAEWNTLKNSLVEKIDTKPATDIKYGNINQKLFLINGNGGTGKTWASQKLLQEDEINKNFKKIFFWSSYYTNDILVGVDRALEFLGEDRAKPITNTRLERLKSSLKEPKNLLVFDGIEKLLIANKSNTKGKSISPEVKTFFKIISSPETKSSIVLTSRLTPQDLDNKIKPENTFNAPRCWFKDIEENLSNHISDELKEIAKEIFSLINGHTYCVQIVVQLLSIFAEMPQEEEVEKYKKILRNLTQTPPDKRIERVIEETIKYLDRHCEKKLKTPKKLIHDFLGRITLFMSPVTNDVLQICFKLTLKQLKKEKQIESFIKNGRFDKIIFQLVEKRLIQEISIEQGKKIAYTVHPLIRNHIFDKHHKALFSSPPTLQLPGFSSGTEMVDPGARDKGVKVVTSTFKALCEQAKETKVNKNDSKKAGELARSAFGILRSRCCSNTVSRWTDYGEYLKLVFKMYDTVKTVAVGTWRHQEANSEWRKKVEVRNAPLYPDELAWIYNEIGVTSFSMGKMLNCYAVFEQGWEINKLLDSRIRGRYLYQSNLNLGSSNIYLGNLIQAKPFLDEALSIATQIDDNDLKGRVLGYIAILKYLQGNLDESEQDFDKTYKLLKRNIRGKSMFSYFQAELFLKRGKLDEAKNKIKACRSYAESAYYPDLVAYSRLAQANWYLQNNELSKAQTEYSTALEEARRLHIYRLEAGVLSGLSRWAYKLNDSEVACQRAIQALKVANENLLGLHQTLGLLVLGDSMLLANKKNLGISYLKQARKMAKAQGYFLRMGEAEEKLQKLGISINSEEK